MSLIKQVFVTKSENIVNIYGFDIISSENSSPNELFDVLLLQDYFETNLSSYL